MTTTTALRRRSFLTAAAGAVGAGALASCSRGDTSSEEDGEAAGGSGGARVAWYGGQPVHDGMAAALAAFSTEHPDVTVATEFAPFDSYWERMATQTAGGDAPDVMRMSMTYFAEYAGRGALADVSDVVADGGIATADLDTDVAASGDIDGATFGVGQSSIAYAVFVDPEALDRHGLAVPETGWTWDDFEGLATEYAAAAGDGSYGCNDNGGALQAFDVYARQNVGDVFGADGTLAVGADVIEEWFALWARLREAGAVPPADVTAEATGFENALIVTDRAPMQWGWVQQVTFYQPLTESALEVVSVPSATSGDLGGLFVKALDLWCVSARSQAPEAAAQVVDFLVNDDRAIEAIGITLGVPPSARARELLGADPESAEGRAIAYVESITDQVGAPPPPWPNGYSSVSSSFARANEGVAFGDMTPTDAAAMVVSDAEGALAG